MGRLSFDLSRTKVQDRDCECNSTLFEDNEDQNDILSGKKLSRQYEPSKKMYLLFFISTTVVTCFCIFVVIPQLIDYFTSANVAVPNTKVSEKDSVINLLDVERSRRNQERLEIMEKFDTLQQSYKLLKIEYEKAKENYLKKLQNAQGDSEKFDSETDSVGQSTYTSSENDVLVNISNITETSDINQDLLTNKILHSILVK